MLLGVTGRNAAGKSAVINWFAKQGFTATSLSDGIREWLSEQAIPPSRENLIDGGRRLRAAEGSGALAQRALARVSGISRAIIDSVRLPQEVEVLATRPDFVLLEVVAPREVRWQRLLERGRVGDATTIEEFTAHEEAELVQAETRFAARASRRPDGPPPW